MRDRLKQLSTGVAIYGAGDVAIQVVNFALLAVYVKGGFLTALDFGGLALLGAIEAFAKVLSRWGLDGAFMRYYHEDAERRPRLASTILWFLLAANTLVFAGAFAAAPFVAVRLFDDPAKYLPAANLMLANTWLIAATFLPFHSMRMQRQAVAYSALTFARSVGTVVLRIALVIWLGLGLTGVYLADLAVTLLLLPVLWRWGRPLVAFTFSWDDLSRALRFGLPRVPHGMAQQILDGGNKLLLNRYITQPELGVFQNGQALGTAIKFFTGAFETAWAPFYYAAAREPDGKITLAKVATYGVAVLALLVAAMTAVAHDVVLVVLTPDYLRAADLLPIIALGMALQGVYLLTSIGLNLTSRTEVYPVATFTAAAAVLAGGVWLMPRHGALGAALAFLFASAVQAGLAGALAHRFYPMRYETARIARVVVAGLGAALLARWAVPSMAPLAGLVVRGGTAVIAYALMLWWSGFLRPSERAYLVELVTRVRGRGWRRSPDGTSARL